MRNRPGRWDAFKGLSGALIPKAKEPRTPKKAVIPERTIQAQCEAWLRVKSLFFIRIPDSMNRGIFANPEIPLWTKKHISDFIKGIPDLTILKDGRYLCVEIKTTIGKLTHEQEQVLKVTGCLMVRSFEEFREVVENWLDKINTEIG